MDSRCVLTRENRGSFLAIYIAKVRITVHADGATIVREGHGSGEGRGTSLARCTILRSRPRKPTPPNGRSRPSADHSGLSSIARIRMPFRQARQQSGRRQWKVLQPSRVSVYTRTTQLQSQGRRTTMAGAMMAP